MQPCGLQRGHHRPIGVGREIGRGGLDDDFALRRKPAGDQAVHRYGIQFAEREVGGVGQVDDDDVETAFVFLQPFCRVVIDDFGFRVRQRTLVQAAQFGRSAEGFGHFGIQIHQRQLFYLRVFQHFPRSQSVAAAQNQHVFRLLHHLHGGQHQGFVVTRLVARRKLQVAVDVEPRIVFPLRYHQPLVGRVAFKHHRIAEIALFGTEGNPVGVGKGQQQQHQHRPSADLQPPVIFQTAFEDAGGQQRDGGIQYAEQQGRTRHPQPRDEHQREQQRNRQRAEIVESQHLGHQLFEVRLFAVQHPHHQRNLHAHHRADHQHQRVQQRAERRGGQPEGHKQGQGRYAADNAHQQLDFDKAAQGVFVFDVLSQMRPDAHGEQIKANNRGKLQNAVAEQVAGQRGHNQLVSQTAACDDENGNNQRAVEFHVFQTACRGKRRLYSG